MGVWAATSDTWFTLATVLPALLLLGWAVR